MPVDDTTEAGTVVDLVDDALAVARAADRPDLVERLAVAKARVARPGTVVVVVGEFKQGKSSLVNALLDREVCPVDDDLATSVVTVVHHAASSGAIARRHTDEGLVVEEVALDDVRDHVTEAGNPGNRRGLERLDLGVPAPLLADGLVIVDTPGMGGLGAGHAASTLGFLPYADALLFVTDASQELTQPEVDLLRRAVATCPVVLTCLTKVDLHPAWRRILELDRDHLAEAGIATEVVPVSATVRAVATERGDADLDAESGLPELEARLREEVVERARRRAAAATAAQVAAVAEQLDAATAREVEALRDPTRVAALQADVERARERLAQLRGPGARWATVLGDRITDLGQQTTHELRRAVRELVRGLDDEVDELATDEDWQRLARTTQARTAEVVAGLFALVDAEAAGIRDELAELLGAEDLALPGDDDRGGFDVVDLWAVPDAPTSTGGAKPRGPGAMQQARSGLVMFGMLGRVLPAAATSLLASNPIMLGAGVLLGGKALVDQRRRQVTERRHAARRALRQFLDDLQFELTPVLADAVREVHRSLRDDVAATVDELHRTWTEAGERAAAAVAATSEERAARLPVLEVRLQTLARLRAEATVVAEETP